MNEQRRVQFFFVGIGKCGTSWLYDFAKRRGVLAVPSIKEPYLVDQPPARQRALERSLYDGSHRMAEFSTLYYWDPENPAKLLDYNPEAKVIVTTRRPSDRIASHFGFMRRRGQYVRQSMAEYLVEDPERIVERSRYAPVIERYRARLGPERVLVLPMEQLRAEPQRYVDRLLGFVGADPVTLDEEDLQVVLKGAAPRVPAVAYAAKRAADLLRRWGLLRALGRLKDSSAVNALLYRERRPEERIGRDFGARTDTIAALDADYEALLVECGVVPGPKGAGASARG